MYGNGRLTRECARDFEESFASPSIFPGRCRQLYLTNNKRVNANGTTLLHAQEILRHRLQSLDESVPSAHAVTPFILGAVRTNNNNA
jgi:hypothetical protein